MGCMDDAIVSDLPDLTNVTLSELLDPPPELRAIIDAATERIVQQLEQHPDDNSCC